MQCEEHTPCQTVCPQQAVELDKNSGIVFQMAQRCLGCRYCMAACPYHTRYFNWWDPEWPAGMEKTLNPGVAPRMRGVVEKCNFCYHRTSNGLQPACVEACPAKARIFGDQDDPASEIAKVLKAQKSFRLQEKKGTKPNVHYVGKYSARA
jgi:molybdopterin-containing oxidoreductase family iron-sulfur binding subunit